MKEIMMKRVSLLFLMVTLVMTGFSFSFGTEAYADSQVTVTNQNATKDQITFNWSIDVPGATKYKIARNPNNRMLVPNGELENGKASGSIKDINLSNGITCQYRIAAYDDSGRRLAHTDVKIRTLGVGNVGAITAYPGYQSITLQWKNVDGATKYLLRQWSAKTNGTHDVYVPAKSGTYTAYKDTYKIEANTNYAYSVWAIGADRSKSAARSKTGNVKCVRQMYQNIKVNGKWKVANGFSGGTFYCRDGSTYSVSRVSAATCDYTKSYTYPNQAATNFVNEWRIAKKIDRKGKKYLVWVSTYTQHLYLFKWTSRGWTLVNRWEVSTGGAGSPTPMGLNKKKIDHRHSQRSRSYYWSCFSSHNALHANPSGEVIDGAPHSHGCVRNPRAKAKWIHDGGLPIGTPVLVW